MNFAREIVDTAPADGRALVELAREGSRREWSFGEVARPSARLAGTLQAHGVARGDVVMTLIGNRPEWVLTMVACFRIGAVVLPCNEQLRAKDLRLRLAAAQPRADRRRRAQPSPSSTLPAPTARCSPIPDESLFARASPAPAVELDADDPCLITFTSGTTGEPKGGRPRPALPARPAAAGRRTGSAPGPASWCGARPPAAGPSRRATPSSRPGCAGAAALLHDARFDPARAARDARRASASTCSAWRRPSTA